MSRTKPCFSEAMASFTFHETRHMPTHSRVQGTPRSGPHPRQIRPATTVSPPNTSPSTENVVIPRGIEELIRPSIWRSCAIASSMPESASRICGRKGSSKTFWRIQASFLMSFHVPLST
jgi:hypothetical protein